MASYGRKRPHQAKLDKFHCIQEILASRKEESSKRPHLTEALPGGAFTRISLPKSISDFEAALSRAESGGGDVVQVWTDFALWAKRLSAKEHLTILRRACHSLSTEKRYAQDIRHLRLWVSLADKDSKAAEIFGKLQVHGIGTQHALLYEAWAHCLESRRDFEGAARVYRRGLNSSAQPQARLQARRADFDERMRHRKKRHDAPSTPRRENSAWRLSNFRAIKTSLKKPSKFSIKLRTPRKEDSKSHRIHPVQQRFLKEPRNLTEDTRVRLTCRKQVESISSKPTFLPPPEPKAPYRSSGELERPEAHPILKCNENQVKINDPGNIGTFKCQGVKSEAISERQRQTSQVNPTVNPTVAPEKAQVAKPTQKQRSFLGWLVPFGGLFRHDDEEDYLEDCEEESVLEDDEMDFSPSPPQAKRGFLTWLPFR